MFSLLSSRARSGVIAVAALSMLPVAAPAAPIGPTAMPAVADSTLPLTLVQGEGRDGGPAYRWWRRQGPRNLEGRRLYRRDYRRDFRREFRREARRPSRYRYRDRYWGPDFWGPGIVLNFGVPAYRYRPSYGARYAGAHVEWCYARYRSYRAWDNTYQPYRGPRRQCISPYS